MARAEAPRTGTPTVPPGRTATHRVRASVRVQPGRGGGRGTDLRVAEVLGIDVFRSDVLGLNGLDDRRQSQGVLAQA
ncbi:hypothetical protein [Streptomyces sp. 900105245]|uniref:Uncharacterized protein n=1 Tax=Streptomyces sp. 900105245 TaxID=3154379 RepID=A0ABV1UIG4_9ACTN